MKLNKISKSFFINLDRRTDRLDHIYKNTPFFTEKFPGVDATSLELTDEIKKLFPRSYFKLKKSEIACALSHYRLWQNLAKDKNADNYLILEDDVVFEGGFVNFWNQVFSKNIPEDYYLIYLGGCQPWNKTQYHKAVKPYNSFFNQIKQQDFFTKGDHYWHMNTQSYIISKQAASLLCQWAETQGLDSFGIAGIDFFMINFINKNTLFSSPHKLYHLNPLMTHQLHESNNNIELDKNSDIRFDKNKFEEDLGEKFGKDLKRKQKQFIQLKDQWAFFKDYDFLNFFENSLSYITPPNEKYTCYNPGQKIAIVSLYTSDISSYAIESENSIKQYAFKQGYTFYVYRDNFDKSFHPNWSKPKVILNHIDDHESIIWMDSDTIVFNPKKKFETIISKCVPSKKIIACQDIGRGSLINSGVLIFKSHQYSKNILKHWLNYECDKSSLYSDGGDQEILCKILKKIDGFNFNTKIFPMSEFNTDPRFVNNDTFILHFMAYKDTLKSVFMRYWGSL